MVLLRKAEPWCRRRWFLELHFPFFHFFKNLCCYRFIPQRKFLFPVGSVCVRNRLCDLNDKRGGGSVASRYSAVFWGFAFAWFLFVAVGLNKSKLGTSLVLKRQYSKFWKGAAYFQQLSEKSTQCTNTANFSSHRSFSKKWRHLITSSVLEEERNEKRDALVSVVPSKVPLSLVNHDPTLTWQLCKTQQAECGQEIYWGTLPNSASEKKTNETAKQEGNVSAKEIKHVKARSVLCSMSYYTVEHIC